MFWFQQTRPQTTLLLFVCFAISTLKQGLSGADGFEKTYAEEKSIINGYLDKLPQKVSEFVKERYDKLPKMKLLLKLDSLPYNLIM